MLIHSWIYYYGNDSLVTDKEFDSTSKQLVELQKNIDDVKNTQYGYVFQDFDGTTGFDLYERLNENDRQYIYQLANHIIWLYHRDLQKGEKK